MKYWIVLSKAMGPLEPPHVISVEMSFEDAERSRDLDMEVFEAEADEYEITTIVVPLSPRR